MGTQVNGRRRIPNREKLTAEDDALNQIAREAEARLAAKRAARAEAREIRMKELERQQKEMYNSQKKYYGLDSKWRHIEKWMEESERYSHPSRRHTSISDDEERMSVGSRGSFRGAPVSELHCSSGSLPSLRHQSSAHNGRVEERPERDFLDKGSRTASTLSAATLASLGGPSSRRGSCDTSFSVETEASIRDIKDSLAESEEKYRRAMVSNAQLHNEKSYLMYQVDTLKEELADMEERLWEKHREHGDKTKELDRERHAHGILQFKFKNVEQTLRQSEELLNEVAQLRLARDGSAREITDLQETLEWKEKKIAALERHVEFSDSVRGERDQLRGEVVRHRGLLKKHGIELSPEITTNGDAGQMGTDGTDSQEILAGGGESTLGSIQEQQTDFNSGRAPTGSSDHVTENLTDNISPKVHDASPSTPCSLVGEYTGIDARSKIGMESHSSRRVSKEKYPVGPDRRGGYPIKTEGRAKQPIRNEPAPYHLTEGGKEYTIQTDRAKGLSTCNRTDSNVQPHNDKYTKFTWNHLVERANKESLSPERLSRNKAAEFCFGGTNLHAASNSNKMDPSCDGNYYEHPMKAHKSGLVSPLSAEAGFLQSKAVALNGSSGKQHLLSGENEKNRLAVTTVPLTYKAILHPCFHLKVNGVRKDKQETRNEVENNAGNIQHDKTSDFDCFTYTQDTEGGEKVVNREKAVLCTCIPVENQEQNNGPTVEDYNAPIPNRECCSSEEEADLDQETTGEPKTQIERTAPLLIGLEPFGESGQRRGRHCDFGSTLEITLEEECPLVKNESLWDMGGIWSGSRSQTHTNSTVTDDAVFVEHPDPTGVDGSTLGGESRRAKLSEIQLTTPCDLPYQPDASKLYQADNSPQTFKGEKRSDGGISQRKEHASKEGKVEFLIHGSGPQDQELPRSGDLHSGNSRDAPTEDLWLSRGASADARSQCPRNRVEVGSSKPIVLSSSPTEMCYAAALGEAVQGMMKGFMDDRHMAAKISKILPQVPLLFQQWLLTLEDIQENHTENLEDIRENKAENVKDIQQNHMEDVEDIQGNNMENLEDIQGNHTENVEETTVGQGPLGDLKGPLCDASHTLDGFQMATHALVLKDLPYMRGAPSCPFQQGSPITDTMEHSATRVKRINSTEYQEPPVPVLHNSELLSHVATVEMRSTTKYTRNLFGVIGGVRQKSSRVMRNGNQEVERTPLRGGPRVELELLGAEDPGNQKPQGELKTATDCDEMVPTDSSSKTDVWSEGQETKPKRHRFRLITSKHVGQRPQRAKSGIEMLVYEFQEMVIPEIQEMVIPELAMINRPLCEKHLKECQKAAGITAHPSRLSNWHCKEDSIGLLDSCVEANLLAGTEATAKHRSTAQLELTILQPIVEVFVQEGETSLVPVCVKQQQGRKGLPYNERRNQKGCSIS
ncbi:uncharacterized protein lrrfip1b isoform X5 [Gadus morhua]|uniref:uncharacterized protein lrrfip1b isoform X5 n=1 Tax=Gadus morhua TaxID=8049 RepID=UPI0011B7228C|nr:leucine-rich repeat flightless-interacting protein 1 isoform X5 [Gadus morhua]